MIIFNKIILTTTKPNLTTCSSSITTTVVARTIVTTSNKLTYSKICKLTNKKQYNSQTKIETKNPAPLCRHANTALQSKNTQIKIEAKIRHHLATTPPPVTQSHNLKHTNKSKNQKSSVSRVTITTPHHTTKKIPPHLLYTAVLANTTTTSNLSSPSPLPHHTTPQPSVASCCSCTHGDNT